MRNKTAANLRSRINYPISLIFFYHKKGRLFSNPNFPSHNLFNKTSTNFINFKTNINENDNC